MRPLFILSLLVVLAASIGCKKEQKEDVSISIVVTSYAVTDFEGMLEDEPPEIEKFVFTRIIDTDVWVVESTNSSGAKAQEEMRNLSRFLEEWGQKAADSHIAEIYPEGALISYLPAVNELHESPSYLLGLNEERKKQNKSEMATPRKPSD
jgi:hypothetical protein